MLVKVYHKKSSIVKRKTSWPVHKMINRVDVRNDLHLLNVATESTPSASPAANEFLTGPANR